MAFRVWQNLCKIVPVTGALLTISACQETTLPEGYNRRPVNYSGDLSEATSTGGASGSSSGTSQPLPSSPSDLPDPDNDDAGNASATYSQRPGGLLTHPDLKGGAPITGGTMNVSFSQRQVTLGVTGMTSSKSEARKGVEGMNGTTTFDRVLYASLPDNRRYKDHPYLIFANAMTNKDNQRFTIKSPDLVPIYASAKDNVDAYMNLLKKGRVKYQVTVIGPDRSEVPITFTVSRALDGYLPACPNSQFTDAATTIDDVDRNFAVKIVVTGIPQSWFGKFPMTDTIYINEYAGGGSTKTIASCREIYDSERKKNGTVKFEFAR